MPAKIVKVSPDTHRQIEALKVHPRETMDDVIHRLLEFAEMMDSGRGHEGRILDTLGKAAKPK